MRARANKGWASERERRKPQSKMESGGAPLVGFFTRLKDSTAYEILAKSATYFIIVDTEHGSFDRSRLADCLFAGRKP
jgi:2-keto-3-deoxy-L-rhamnonate aldolase RhmA